MVPKRLGDMKIAQESETLNLAAIHANTISVWYSQLRSLNYDDEIDSIPVSEPRGISDPVAAPSGIGPEPMQIDPPLQPLHHRAA